MNKLFTKKMMFVFLSLFLVFTVLGGVMTGLNISYTNQFAKATASSNDLTTKITNGLANIISSLTTTQAGQETTTQAAEEETVQYTSEQQALLNKKNVTLAAMITFFILGVVNLVLTCCAGVFDRKQKELMLYAKAPGTKKNA